MATRKVTPILDVPCPRCGKPLVALATTIYTCKCGFNLRLTPGEQ